MKTSIEWLKEYTDIDVTPKELSDILTMTGSKVEGIESKGNDIKNVVVGKILEIEKHPNADKLIVTKVNIGEEVVQIVTGADNVKVGDIIPIAKDGSELPGDIKIKKGSLRGVESCGMMCSIGELGLTLADYPDQIEHGIMILPTDYEQYLGNDIVDVFEACIDGTLDPVDLKFDNNRATVCVILASDGYPLSYQKGFVIEGLERFNENEGYYVFHSGTKFNENGQFITNGGRVLGVTANGATLKEARANAYKATEWVKFENKYMRTDIGKAIDEA